MTTTTDTAKLREAAIFLHDWFSEERHCYNGPVSLKEPALLLARHALLHAEACLEEAYAEIERLKAELDELRCEECKARFDDDGCCECVPVQDCCGEIEELCTCENPTPDFREPDHAN